MTLTTADLRKICDAATPGPWREVTNKDKTVNVLSAPDDDGFYTKVCLVNGRDSDCAAFIATFNPTRVRAMLDEIEALKDRIDDLENVAEEVSAEFEGDCWMALRALLDDQQFDWSNGDPVTAQDALDWLRQDRLEKAEAGKRAIARAEAAEALVKEAGEVVRPFANTAAADIGEDETDGELFQPMSAPYARAKRITVGDLRTAAAFLAKIDQPKEPRHE